MAALPGGHFFCAFPDGTGYVPPSGKARCKAASLRKRACRKGPDRPAPIDPAIFRFFAHRRAIF